MSIRNIQIFLVIFIFIEFINAEIVLTGTEKIDRDGNLYYLWLSNNEGKARMGIQEVNHFNCTWKNVRDVMCQYIKDIRPSKIIEENYIEINYESQLNAEGYAFVGIYGYGKMLNETFYIVENYTDDFVPPENHLGTTTIIDGSEYDTYIQVLTYGPNHLGIEKSTNYWNVRKVKRDKGTIHLKEHFKSWKLKGYEFTEISRVTFLSEGKEGKGKADMNKLKLLFHQY